MSVEPPFTYTAVLGDRGGRFCVWVVQDITRFLTFEEDGSEVRRAVKTELDTAGLVMAPAPVTARAAGPGSPSGAQPDAGGILAAQNWRVTGTWGPSGSSWAYDDTCSYAAAEWAGDPFACPAAVTWYVADDLPHDAEVLDPAAVGVHVPGEITQWAASRAWGSLMVTTSDFPKMHEPCRCEFRDGILSAPEAARIKAELASRLLPTAGNRTPQE